ncbi:MAG TPA: cellulase family glycosylhydrolase [Flavitalea sp.]|nr:cellulase family glycosylhydrolase [Flavitalea sp.]
MKSISIKKTTNILIILPLILLLFSVSCRKELKITGPVQSADVVATRYLVASDFLGKKLRGFDLGPVPTLSVLSGKNLAKARATGANLARYWIRVKHDASNVYSFTDPGMLNTLDSAVRLSEKIGLYLIVTLEVLPNQGTCDLWGNTARKDGVKKIWQQLATRYKGRKIIAAYDLINEPRINTTTRAGSTTEYIAWQIDVIKAIRLIDPYHVIAVEVLNNGMLNEYSNIDILFKNYKNLIASPHGYSPLSITHQGYGGNNIRRVFPDPASTIYNSSTYFTKVSYWKVMADFKLHYPAVPIWVGEFACINWAPKNSFSQWTSTRWIEDAIKYMEANNISWCYHSWREWQGWDPEIPSSYYTKFTFSYGSPNMGSISNSTWSTQRSSTAPTIMMLKKYFALNQQTIY